MQLLVSQTLGEPDVVMGTLLGLALSASGIMSALWTAVGWRTAFVPPLFPAPPPPR